jgi:transcriptional regulator with XRE-family HTH domain
MTGTKIRLRLRRPVFDDLATKHSATTVDEQVELTGVPRRTLCRIRAGGPPRFETAVQLADAFGVPMDELFERVEDAA